MVTIYSISSFGKALKKLLKKKGHEKTSELLCDKFKNLKIEEYRDMKVLITDEKKYRKIKVRIKGESRGKSGGYRLLFLVHKEKEFIVLFTVYPKKGSSGKETVSNNDLKKYISSFISEYKEGALIKYDISGSVLEAVDLN